MSDAESGETPLPVGNRDLGNKGAAEPAGVPVADPASANALTPIATTIVEQKQREFQELARDAERHGRLVARGRSAVLQATWTGPLPPPAILRGYAEIDPTFPDRMMRAWAKETAHRRKMENRQLDLASREIENEWDLRREGVRAGKWIGVLGLLVAFGLGVSGATVAAAIVGSVDLVGLVGVFVIGSRKAESAHTDDDDDDSDDDGGKG